MKYVFILLFPAILFAKDVEIQGLYIEGERAVLTNRPYEMPPNHKKKYGLALGLDLKLHKYGYFDQKINGMTGQRQFRHISWEFETGARPNKYIEIYYRHYSGHALDAQYPNKFPETNSIGVRFHLIHK